MTDFQTFMNRRDAAATAYCQGDATPVNTLVARHHLASFFGPDGGNLQGAESIKAAFAKGASAFGAGGKSRLEIIHAHADGDAAYWCGLQHAEVETDGKTVPMTLRITELFRREDGDWKLVHRHADVAKTE